MRINIYNYLTFKFFPKSLTTDETYNANSLVGTKIIAIN